jgi:hypothetical protein
MAARAEASWMVEYAENLLLGVALCDRLAQPNGMSSEQFHAMSVDLWLILTETEKRILQLRQRNKRRNRKWRRSAIARAASAELRQSHKTAWVKRAELLEERKGLIKQVGDALAWTLALGDPRFIIPLYKPSTHNLPVDHSVDGILRMLEAGAGTSDYLVVPTDLTRCCGIGDFLIRGSRWPCPTPFEAKVKRQSDGTLLSMLHGWNPAFQVDPDEMERFKASFGLTTPERVSFDERGERQKMEVNHSTRDATQSFVDLAKHADPSIKRNWSNLEGVLERAAKGQIACDLVEPGVAYAAAPLRALNPNGNVWDPVIAAFSRIGVDVSGGEWETANSVRFMTDPELSPLVLPIALWKIPSRLKAILMTQQVVLVTATRKGIWQAAFRAVRVGLEEQEDGAWKMSAGGRDQLFDCLDVRRLKHGLWYAGVSPRHTATVVSTQLYMPGVVYVDRYGRPSKSTDDGRQD